MLSQSGISTYLFPWETRSLLSLNYIHSLSLNHIHSLLHSLLHSLSLSPCSNHQKLK